jgi:transglutaminase-like putative cysteine protease
MDYLITHRTTYEYAEPVSVSHHAARFEPRTEPGQECIGFRISITPPPAVTKTHVDYFGNHVCVFSIQQLHQRMEVLAESTVSMAARTPPVPALSPRWTEVQARFRDPVSPADVRPYEFCMDSPLVGGSPELAEYARKSFPDGTPLLLGVRDLTRRIHREFQYDPRATDVATPLAEVWAQRRGVCQDFAHIGIACLRSLGLAARYVSGYLRTVAPPGKVKLIGADASHAWYSVYCPHTGWVDFDPTNDMLPADEHVTIGVGRDFSDVSPLSGILTGGGEHEVSVAVDMVPVG